MPEFIITTTEKSINGDENGRVSTSRRRNRAIRHARRLRATNRNVMLFEKKRDGWFPVSLREAEVPRYSSGNGCNSWTIGRTPDAAELASQHDILKHARVRTKGRRVQAA